MAEVAELCRKLDDEGKRLQLEFGISDSLLEALEQAQIPEFEERYWRKEVQQTPVAVKLESVVGAGFERLMSTVDQNWLKDQAKFNHRMQYRDRAAAARLHLVGRVRLLPEATPQRPHRFAEMLLTAKDFLDGRHDIDFFTAPMLVSEVATLGRSLDLIPQLGAEAESKMYALAKRPSVDVAATVYELLVGIACIRAGRTIEMLPAVGAGKSPDFRVTDCRVPIVVECKRRDGLSEFVKKEAREVERLYSGSAELFERHHISVEVVFRTNVEKITIHDFRTAIESILDSWDDFLEGSTEWGNLNVRRLPISCAIPTTRVFSPNFLRNVFSSGDLADEWDGILCEIDPLSDPVTDQIKCPRCLKWKCIDPKSVLKKSRGLTSLWASAVDQVPTGEMGCIYIAYTENMRPEIADARTQHLIDSCKTWFVNRRTLVPLTFVNRLYPQPMQDGGLDFIESTMPLVADGANHMLADFPWQVFTFSE